MIWQDFDLSGVEESYRLQFLADYYNAAVPWNKDVVATYKDGFDSLGEVFDYERGGAGSILTPYWLTDDSVYASTWCYVTGITLYDTQTMLHSLIDHVSIRRMSRVFSGVRPMCWTQCGCAAWPSADWSRRR
ncbi:hypothetical protein KDK95_06570 [Actinospica sp. MGRD01-02]|uniref:Glycoside hydrolase family 29 N-terminal domain-containing protein n=1 Tax=Actinospica acidithermotolerans TaxID=2828514 RepID=A0A941E4B5_9ACTN|nr:alpha-L-fucosidase [Actinospica acidithermotolerans]MBR7825965.1 hypothetical protein [Actinospica acidithermotolerans]